MPEESSVLDDVERGILYYLQSDPRNTTNTDISTHLDVSATTVGTRIDELEESDIIKTYNTAIDFEKAGFPYRVVLFATVATDERADLAKAALDVHGVIHVHELLSGQENLQIEIVGRTRDEITDTIADVEATSIEITRSEIVKNHYSKPFEGFFPE